MRADIAAGQLRQLLAMNGIMKTVDLPDGRVMLFDSANAGYRAANRVCFNSDGSPALASRTAYQYWPDSFVDMLLEGESIRAVTWSGWTIWFDYTAGTARKTIFAK